MQERLMGRKPKPCTRPSLEIGKYQQITQRIRDPKALETGKVLLNTGEDFVQRNLAMIVERCCL